MVFYYLGSYLVNGIRFLGVVVRYFVSQYRQHKPRSVLPIDRRRELVYNISLKACFVFFP